MRGEATPISASAGPGSPGLAEIVREWGRIGVVGFGGPPAHIALFRELCVERRRWLAAEQFEDAIAATNLLPGPGSTQMAIFCGWRLRGAAGALLGGAAFIVPGLIAILALTLLFLSGSPPLWVRGAGAGAGAAVAAVAVQAGWGLVPGSWGRARGTHPRRWLLYAALGLAAAALLGPGLVLVLLGCGALELFARRPGGPAAIALGLPLGKLAAAGGAGALCWVAFKVGALAYGGGFVIVPLMQADAVDHYHWMTSGEFLNAVALGQVTPGPVTHTIAVVGYAAGGIWAALLASLIAFAPSFSFILIGAERFDRLRANVRARAFLDGAGPAAIGAIVGSAIPLALALTEAWQFATLAVAAVALLVLRRSVVTTLVGAGALGVLLALCGAPVPGFST
ncbi:MAG TPA: chromate efflux transporter [Solirubrobacterales bacterium]|nr:chromate efflux transporter [Solirubrobacterales bacterium]